MMAQVSRCLALSCLALGLQCGASLFASCIGKGAVSIAPAAMRAPRADVSEKEGLIRGEHDRAFVANVHPAGESSMPRLVLLPR
jgi:hypothetical protein